MIQVVPKGWPPIAAAQQFFAGATQVQQTVFNIQKALSQMEVAVNSINEAILWTNAHGQIQWCNNRLADILQRDTASILGRDITEILAVDLDSRPIPLHQHPFQLVSRKGRLPKSVYTYDQDGTIIHLEISGISTKLGDEDLFIVFVVKDVTQTIKSQQQMRHANILLESRIKDRVATLTRISNRFQAILDAAADAIISIDITGTILSINPAAEKMFGWMLFEVEGKNVTMLMPNPYRESHPHYLTRYLTTRSTKVIGATKEVHGITKNGRIFPLQLSVSEVQYENKLIFTAILRDMSSHKAAITALHQAKLAAEKANNAKSDFLAKLSHEVRTPLNAIHGMADLLTESELTENQKRYVDLSRAAGDHLINIIDDLLDIDRIETGEIHLASTPFNLEALVKNVTSIVRHTARTKQLDITYSIAKDVPLSLLGDPKRVKQILINLLGNSVKFTGKGAVTTTVSSIRYEKNTGLAKLRFDINDTGIGIPLDKQNEIFKSFSQADSRITREYGGSGLGLAICKTLVHMMQGEISVKSEPAGGSCFTFTACFTIDRKRHNWADPEFDEEHIVKVDADKLEPEPRTAPLRILLAEDVANNRMLIAAFLQKVPCTLDVAENGEVAVEKYMTGNYDLVLMDVQMPKMDGHSATRIIRRHEQEVGKQPIPIIALTAHAQQADKKASLAAGCTMHITKPVKKQVLIEAIQSLTDQTEKNKSGETDFPER